MTDLVDCIGCLFKTCELCSTCSQSSNSHSHYQSLHNENETDGCLFNCGDKPNKCDTRLHKSIKDCGVCKLNRKELADQDMNRFKVNKSVKKSNVKKTDVKKSNVKKTDVKKN